MVKSFQLVRMYDVAMADFENVLVKPSSFEEKAHEKHGDKGPLRISPIYCNFIRDLHILL